MSETVSDTSTAAGRTFPPPEQLARHANVGPDVYDEAARDRVAFWEKQAEWLRWEEKWGRTHPYRGRLF